MFEVVAAAAVLKRLRRRVPAGVRTSFDQAVEYLTAHADEPRPDRGSWKRVFPALPNHRHLDLRAGWRLCYGIESAKERPRRVIIVFLGTHREYDHKYGFRPSG